MSSVILLVRKPGAGASEPSESGFMPMVPPWRCGGSWWVVEIGWVGEGRWGLLSEVVGIIEVVVEPDEG